MNFANGYKIEQWIKITDVDDIIRPRRSTAKCGLLLQPKYRGLSVSQSVTVVSPAKTAELIKISLTDRDVLWVEDSGGPKEPYVLDGGPDSPWEGAIWRVEGAPCSVKNG